MKKIFALLGIVSASLLIGCGLGQRNAKNREKRDLTLGCVRFNYDEVNNSVAIKDLESMGYKVNVKVLDDALAMNQATIQGEIDASLYQHQPEIDAYNQSQKQNLVMLEPYIHYTVFGMYSDKYHSINDIPQNAKACIPEDSANLARALRLLEQQGLIKLKGDVLSPTILDITENPKNIQFTTANIAQLTQNMPNADFICTAKMFQISNNIDQKAEVCTSTDLTDYGVGFVVTSDNKDASWTKDLLAAYTSDAMKQQIRDLFQGCYVPENTASNS